MEILPIQSFCACCTCTGSLKFLENLLSLNFFHNHVVTYIPFRMTLIFTVTMVATIIYDRQRVFQSTVIATCMIPMMAEMELKPISVIIVAEVTVITMITG